MRRRMALVGVIALLALSTAQLVALIGHLASTDGAAADGASVDGAVADGSEGEGLGPPRPPVEVSAEPRSKPPQASADVYAGQGAWVDVFDYAPAMQLDGAAPPVTPTDVDDMADHGVRTLYLQAAHDHRRTPGPLVDEELLAAFLARAADRDVSVVGWYLPRLEDVERDLAHLGAIAEYSRDGHGFDGIAVDIEWTESVPDHAERSDRLVELSQRLRHLVGDDALGAIVLAPVHIEEVNPEFWPGFPWGRLAPLYDAWLPMGYWTDRLADTDHRDAFAYTVENVGRLRARLGDPGAVVHPVGGVGDETTAKDLERFARSLDEVGAVGGSVYDWEALSAAKRRQLVAALAESSAGGSGS